jgi:hypothetical protein
MLFLKNLFSATVKLQNIFEMCTSQYQILFLFNLFLIRLSWAKIKASRV